MESDTAFFSAGAGKPWSLDTELPSVAETSLEEGFSVPESAFFWMESSLGSLTPSLMLLRGWEAGGALEGGFTLGACATIEQSNKRIVIHEPPT
jgi:hypothetical protein